MTKDQINKALLKRIEDHEKAVYERKQKDSWYIVAGCSASVRDKSWELGTNGSVRNYLYEPVFVDRVQERFNGKTVGEKSDLEKWPIGQCAEQHAANEVIKNSSLPVLDDFQFSDAVFAKDPEVIKPYCRNCKALFDQLN